MVYFARAELDQRRREQAMAIIQLGFDLPAPPAESNEEMKAIRQRLADNDKRIESHVSAMNEIKKRQEDQQTSINRLREVLKEILPTVQRLKGVADMLRQPPNFPTSSAAKQSRLAG